MKRLFFALWPDTVVREHCVAVNEKLPKTIGKPVLASNLHCTLLFLGSVSASQEQSMCAVANALKVSTMNLIFDQLSYWQQPGILCLTGCAVFDPEVTKLVEQLQLIAIHNGISVDARPYKPHITLIRKAKALPDIEFAPIIWQTARFCLVQSSSFATGVEYRVIRSWG